MTASSILSNFRQRSQSGSSGSPLRRIIVDSSGGSDRAAKRLRRSPSREQPHQVARIWSYNCDSAHKVRVSRSVVDKAGHPAPSRGRCGPLRLPARHAHTVGSSVRKLGWPAFFASAAVAIFVWNMAKPTSHHPIKAATSITDAGRAATPSAMHKATSGSMRPIDFRFDSLRLPALSISIFALAAAIDSTRWLP